MRNIHLQNHNNLPTLNLAPTDNLDSPSFDWTREAFIRTVRLNENWHRLREISARLRPIPSATMPFRASMLKPKLCVPNKHAATVTEKILSILLNSQFRKGALSTISHHILIFKNTIEEAVLESRPIELVLPTLPCKNLNPLCTAHPAHVVDLGEWAFFAQLQDIVLSIKNIFAPGAHITLFCDGVVYADIFWDGDANSANLYREACEKIRDEMKLQGVVDLVDMASLVSGEPRFEDVRSKIIEALNQLAPNDLIPQEKFSALRRGMLMNLPLFKFSFDDVARMQALQEKEWPREVFYQAHKAAVGFASFLIAAQHTKIISRAFPRAIRCTVHPKDAPQLPLHLVNRNSVVFPYNGITVVSRSKWDRTGDLRSAVKTTRLCDILGEPGPATAVIRIGDSHPFFFMMG